MQRREDDTESTVVQRLLLYDRQTLPLVDYFRSMNMLRDVPADLDPAVLGCHLYEIVRSMMKFEFAGAEEEVQQH